MITSPSPPAGSAALPDYITAGMARAEDAENRGSYAAAAEHYGWVLSALPVGAGPAVAARVIRRIARCHINSADYAIAADCLEAARAIGIASNDPEATANAVNLLGVVEWQSGNLDAARDRYEEALAIARESGAQATAALVHQNLGILANIQGDYESARDSYEISLAMCRSLGLREHTDALLNNLGMVHTDLRDWRAAERAYADALRGYRAAGDVAGSLRVQANRVELYIHLGRFRKARRVCRTVLREVAAGAHGQWLGETYKHLGVIGRETGHLQDAERCFARAVAEAKGRSDALLLAETLREAAVVYRRQGKTQEALAALNRSHEIFTALRARRDLSDIDGRLRSLESDFLDIVARWVASIESTDRYTYGHSERVAEMGCQLAREAGVAESEILWFHMGALLHDVGKILVPVEILNKVDRLTPAEWAVIREHPAMGERLVADATFPLAVMPMIRHHHERWDGTGYPDRLAGEDIPFWARLLCIADVYDALTTTRSYRGAFSASAAVAIMREESGRTFDPALLDLFLERVAQSESPDGASSLWATPGSKALVAA